MDSVVIAQFAFATLLPVFACALLTIARRSLHERVSERAWQVIAGVVFGAIAIYGTEAGIPVSGAMMNVRDAAPLAAGLFFGGPAGIIAGLIGGIERWLAVMWGVGEFTQLACSLGTIIAGAYAAALRKFLFDGRMPTWPMALASGVVAEVIHLLLVFVTNFGETVRAFQVVQLCTLPMVGCVALSTTLSALVVATLNKQPLVAPRAKRGIAQVVQSRLLIAVVTAFLITVGFTTILQASMSEANTRSLLLLNIEDAENDVSDASNANLLGLTQRVADNFPSVSDASSKECTELANELSIPEINVVNSKGIIVACNNPAFEGFDMSSGKQSREFLTLLDGRTTQFVQSYQPMAYDNNVWRKYAGVSIKGGFVQVGYDADDFLDDLHSQVKAVVKNRHVGQGGGLIIIDEAGDTVSSRLDMIGTSTAQLKSDAQDASVGQVFETTLEDEAYLAMFDEVESYRIIAYISESEANFSRNVSVLIMAFMEVLVYAALFLVIYFAIKRTVVRSIWQVNGRLSQITRGDLGVEVDVRATTEFASLSDDINMTVTALKDSIAAVQTDLDMAADIQANSLPSLTPAITQHSEFELFASMEPAKEVGGDFYDFFMVDDDHLALVVADVSGKGVPAALFMMLSKTVIKMEALSGLSPAEVLYKANADLSEKNDDDMFTTAWLGVLEISTGKLVYADAGHEKLAIFHNGTWELPPKPNGAVALASFDQLDYDDLPEKYHFRNEVLHLQPGDAIFQYTDGVTEATDDQDELFGEELLLDALGATPTTQPKEVLPCVREHIAMFVKDAAQFDDITMLGLLYKG